MGPRTVDRWLAMLPPTACLCIMVLSAMPGVAAISLSVAEPRARSAVLAVDGETAVRVLPTDVWQALNPISGKRLVRFVETDPAEGARCASLTSYERDPTLAPELSQRLGKPLEPGRAYDLRMQCRGQIGALADLVASVESRKSTEEPWSVVADVPLWAGDAWAESGGTFRAPEGAVEIRVAIRLIGKGSAYIDSVVLSVAGPDKPNLLVDGGFEGVCSWRLQYRKHGETAWRTDPATIHEPRHTLLDLEPATRYEARADLVNSSGEVLESSVPIYFDTEDIVEREGLGLLASEPLRTGEIGLLGPAMVQGASRPVLVASHGGGIYAHTVEPDGQLGEPLLVLPAAEYEGSPVEIGDLTSCLEGDTLYVLYRYSPGAMAADQALRLLACSLETGKVTGPYSIRPTDYGRTVLPGGIALLEGSLWVAFAEAFVGEGGPRSRVILRALDPHTLQAASDDVVLPNPPSDCLFGPSLARLGEKLVVLYSDMRPIEEARHSPRESVEPLYAQILDESGIGRPIEVCADGRSRRAAATEVDGRLAIVWQYGGPDPETVSGEYIVQDIGFAWLGADGTVEGPWSCVRDGTYNETPTIGVVNGRLCVVCRKWEHHPALPDDPAADLGLWVSFLRPATP